MMFQILKRLTAVALLSAAMVSCEADDGRYYYADPEVAYGIIANASPDSGDLYFFADENRVNQYGLNYTDANGYFSFYPGERVLKLKNEAGETLASDTIQLEIGDIFSAFAANRFEEIELVTYRDTLDYPAQGKVRVRFINLTCDAPEILVQNSSETLATLEFKEASAYMDVTAGSGSTFTFIPTTSESTPYLMDASSLIPGRIYTIYTKGYVAPYVGSNDTFSVETIRNY